MICTARSRGVSELTQTDIEPWLFGVNTGRMFWAAAASLSCSEKTRIRQSRLRACETRDRIVNTAVG